MIIYLLNLLMLFRIVYTFDDERMDFKQLPYFLIMQALGFATLTMNRAWVTFGLSVVVANVLMVLWERKTRNPRIVRIVSLFGFWILYASFVKLSGQITFNPGFISWINDSFSIVNRLDELPRINTYALGLLFTFNESNTIIRQLFDWIKISPVQSGAGLQEVDVHAPADRCIKIDEYKSGRVVGILERLFAYIAVVSHEYSIMGFILAAKAFARFKELEKKAYAEYVLIGTLASIFIAFVAAGFITSLLQ